MLTQAVVLFIFANKTLVWGLVVPVCQKRRDQPERIGFFSRRTAARRIDYRQFAEAPTLVFSSLNGVASELAFDAHIPEIGRTVVAHMSIDTRVEMKQVGR